MAVDETLFRTVAATGRPTLRFYEWERPTMSLGYFQRAADRQQHLASREAELVRRLSGGGAILHDQELTYSLVLPATHRLAQDTQALYDAVHRSILDSLGAFLHQGQSPWQMFLNDQPTELAAADEPLLCFQRRALGDILLRSTASGTEAPTHKIVGSAQRRRRGAVLQHGSILLAASPLAPELLGIAGITGVEVTAADLIVRLPNSLESKLELSLEMEILSQPMVAQARVLQHSKYQNLDWTQSR